MAGALGLLVSRLARYAALGLVVLLTGAVVTNLVILRTWPLSALVLLAVAALVAVVRWRRASAGSGRPRSVKPR
ncbi:hypothetical protein [Micromonospora sp. SL4-19]|uniref:hypothetical protein n=1 Tax=Micromonospora sp. SL4-19 TaxID=3399129 RepID=UPI003A4E21BC